MNSILRPLDQVFWYRQKTSNVTKLTQSLKADVGIVGGGMAGISAAHAFKKKGFSVVLLEKNSCGGGASGKSTGFITPNSELDLAHIIELYGLENARKVWEFVVGGVHTIQNNIKTFSIDCQYQKEDTLTVANTRNGMKEFDREYNARNQLAYQTNRYDQTSITQLIGSSAYVGGISYGDSFSIDPYMYIQAMKQVLIEMGVQIYEDTHVTEIGECTIQAEGCQVLAEKIIVCADYQCGSLGLLKNKVYHVQTFAMISEPLSDKQIHTIFPGNPYLTWDSDLIYQYFRLVENRLLIGGGTYFNSYWPSAIHDSHATYRKLMRYITNKFPELNTHFSYSWPGLIGVSKDLVPIAGPSLQVPGLYIITAATGLAWAAALGNYSADHMVDKKTDMDNYFSPERKFILPDFLNYILSKPGAFGLSNLYTLKIQGIFK